jgi:hypothetical protein
MTASDGTSELGLSSAELVAADQGQCRVVGTTVPILGGLLVYLEIPRCSLLLASSQQDPKMGSTELLKLYQTLCTPSNNRCCSLIEYLKFYY